ncbi:MAG: class B sortase [Clostridia bacterium]|nr:class B sortase [Clostridia bacterium]
MVLRNRTARRRENMLWRLVEWVCIALALALIVSIANRLVSRRAIRNEEQASSVRIETARAVDDGLPTADEIEEHAEQFDSLLTQNADFQGWVLFGDSRSLYVCRGEDNAYYMTHRFDGREDAAGMVFMDFQCTWESQNVLLYGHNMKDGSRFGTLNRYEKPEYLLSHPWISVQTEDGLRAYRPVAVFYASTDPTNSAYFDFEQPNFGDKTDYRAYVASAQERSIYDTGTDVRDGESLLTLVTCSSEVDSGRLVILCRAQRRGESYIVQTEESIDEAKA